MSQQTSQRNSESFEFDKFRLDVSERILWRDGERIPLPEKAFGTLCMLVTHANHLVSKDALLKAVWADTVVEENSLDKSISLLRQVLGERAGTGKFIETVRGHGYRFVTAVRLASGAVNPAPHLDEGDPRAVFHGDMGEAPATAATLTPRRKPVQRAVLALVGMLIVGVLTAYFWRDSARPAPRGYVKSVAVLPFSSLVADGRDEALEMGMTDTLISKLGRSEAVVVRSLSSVRRYAALERDVVSTGRELRADVVLDGSIQTSGDRIRVSARLIQISDGKQLWAGNFDEKFSDIFSVQDSISERVATALKIRLGSPERKRPTQNVEAYQLYMKGRFYLLKAVKQDTDKSISYFQQAIAVDPIYALAYTGLADAYRGQVVGGELPSNEVMPKAKAMALKAIELDDQLAEAHSNLGHLQFWYDWDWIAAERQHKRALELDPNSPDTLQFNAHLLSALGRHTEALSQIRRAREIDPLNVRVNAVEGMLLTYAGRADEAVTTIRKTLELEPNHRLVLMMAARAYTEKGMYAEAITATRRAREISPSSAEPVTYGTYALARSGKTAEAHAGLDELLVSSTVQYVPPYNFALVYNALGQSDMALKYLEKAFAEKDVRMVWLKVEPKWNNLRSEPRFINLMKQMNFDRD